MTTREYRIRVKVDSSEAKSGAAQTNAALGSVGKAAAAAGAAVVAAFSARAIAVEVARTVNEFRAYELALTGVGKTTDLSGRALRDLGRDVQDLSIQIPVAANEILGLAQTAGQLGVAVPDVVKFAETVAKLGRASDLAGEEGATALARILNVTGESTDEVDRLASVIVLLGNNMAATESEIARHTGEVARATTAYEIGSTKAAALGATLAAIGIRAELAGSSVGRSFRVIETAVKSGGEAMAALRDVTGKSADELREAFGRDATEAFTIFLQGLERVRREGGNVAEVLDRLGLGGEENAKVLPTLAARYGLLSEALKMAGTEASNVTALNEEFERGAQTLDSQLIIVSNSLQVLRQRVGQEAAPAVRDLAERFVELADSDDLVRSLGEVAGAISEVVISIGDLLSVEPGQYGPTDLLEDITDFANEAITALDSLLDKQREVSDTSAARTAIYAQREAAGAPRSGGAGSLFAPISTEELDAQVAAMRRQREETDRFEAAMDQWAVDRRRDLGVLAELREANDVVADAYANVIPPAQGMSEEVKALSSEIAANIRQEQFLLDALQRGEAEFRRAELVVAAYNAVIVDGVAQMSLFDDALRLQGLSRTIENTQKLSDNAKKLAENVEDADRAYRDFVEAGIGADSELIDRGPKDKQDQVDLLGYTEVEWAATLDAMTLISDEHMAVINRQGVILQNLQEWQGAAYIVADAMWDIDEALARVVGSAGDFLGALQGIREEGGKINAAIAGFDLARSVGNAVTGPNNYGAEGAAAGALIGALVGAYFTGSAAGAQAGAAVGGSAGGALGSFISKGVDEFLGRVDLEMGKATAQIESFPNSMSQAGKQMADAISRGINESIELLGGDLLSLPQLDIKIRDGVYSVFSQGITARFESMQEAVDFAILQALRHGGIEGISDEVRAALENSTAESFATMASDLDFARWVEGLPEIGEAASESATIIDSVIDQYRAALSKARDLGIDSAKIDQWLAGSLTALRDNILGIAETNEERIRRESEAFNREVQLLEAESKMRRADLAMRKADIEARADELRAKAALIAAGLNLERDVAKMEADILQQSMEIKTAAAFAEMELLHALLGQIEAIDLAMDALDGILANLPDLIGEADIQAAIRRGRGDGGAAQRAQSREDIQAEVLLFGLSDVEAALHNAGTFAADFGERIKDLGFSAEEAARLMGLAQDEQDRLMEEVRGDVRQTYYDAIAQAQGLSEIWGVLDQFRDLRQEILDAGLSAEETAERMRGIDWAEGVELQNIEIGIVDKLFGYLQGEEEWAERSLEFARMKVELEFAVMKGQLQLLGVFAEYLDIFEAAKAAALGELEMPQIVPPARQVRDHISDAAREAERIAESFARAKMDVAEFLNEMLVGQFGGVSPVGGVNEALRQFDEVLRQAKTGNIGAIGEFDDYGSTLLKLARDAYGSSPEFQAIYDYVLASGRDVLGLKQGKEGNLVFDERFYQGQQQQTSEQQRTNALLARIEQHFSRQGGAIVTGTTG